MTTTYTTPEAPAITNERQYIEWFVQYSDKHPADSYFFRIDVYSCEYHRKFKTLSRLSSRDPVQLTVKSWAGRRDQ
ncbi:hypothetical protein [Endozoicomonas sp. GU-1]|uniref:hypothetical protein n=1 Tax=Endozoicomonas sp. GU-1 TaxID=3009078 RepID=UPI0022B428A4|nr:hypothetical protein [Endozoicomonas sp. GU-1]WBA82599.1 hypothetical protein O2T12_05505 [Endozoicomonas sp. GU-1]WBA85528.1 hypothetical protein O3276_20160 [Endozoicomonas sp. GU-1]